METDLRNQLSAQERKHREQTTQLQQKHAQALQKSADEQRRRDQ